MPVSHPSQNAEKGKTQHAFYQERKERETWDEDQNEAKTAEKIDMDAPLQMVVFDGMSRAFQSASQIVTRKNRLHLFNGYHAPIDIGEFSGWTVKEAARVMDQKMKPFWLPWPQ